MKKFIHKIILALLAILTGIIFQASTLPADLGCYSDCFRICQEYCSGEPATLSITSPMHLTLHTYSNVVSVPHPISDSESETFTTISVKDALTGSIVAMQCGSLYRKHVYDPYQACVVLPELPAGTYSVVVEGDESTRLTVEGFLTSPPYSLDGREAGQPIEVGAFSSEFCYSHICDTSTGEYWSGYGGQSKDVFYRFTITVPMYVVATHWGTEPLHEYMPSRMYIFNTDPEHGVIIQEMSSVLDMTSDDNMMGDDNLTSLMVSPDLIPEIEENSSLNASWHGMLLPGTYYIMSEGPYKSGEPAHIYNGPIRTNIRGFVYPLPGDRKTIFAGESEDGVMAFQDSKFVRAEEPLRYCLTLDLLADMTVVTDADAMILEKGDSTLSDQSDLILCQWEKLEPGDYTLTLHSATNREVSVVIASEKYIQPYVPDPLDARQNYIRVSRPCSASHSDPVRIDLENSIQDVEYYDGLGRPLQSVRRRQSPTGEDLANFIMYEYGRPTQEWCETPVGLGNSLIPYVEIVLSSMDAYDDSLACSQTAFEESPLSRIMSVTGPGEAWHTAEKAVEYDYLVNDTTGVLRCLRFNLSSEYNSVDTPVLAGVYPTGTLSVVKTVSEDGVSMYQFTDHTGQTVLSRVVTGDRFSDTYYVYDVRRMLRAVITPLAVDSVNETGSLSDSVYESLCYGYGYDDRGRRVAALNPGRGVTITVYSRNSYPLFSQTPELSAEGKWRFDIPDIFGRSAVTGLCTGTLESIAGAAKNDIHAVFGDGPASTGFWQTTVALESLELHQAFFYDEYSFLELFGERGSALEFSADEVIASRRDARDSDLTCMGRKTGILTAITDGSASNSAVLSTLYYDIYGNVIQTRSENILGGKSSLCSDYDFQGRVMSESEFHSLADGTESLLTRLYEYDRAGRLVQTVTDLDGTEVVTKNTYDPVGRLEMTVVSSGEVSDTTMHTYNVRGWQTSIENDSWSSKMCYINPRYKGSRPSYTGNISEWEWTRDDDTKTYSFTYDDLSRITFSRLIDNGLMSLKNCEHGISYDSNGNILSLKRTGEDGSAVNNLTYHYDGNRLASLSDGDVQSQNYAYDADGNMTFDGRTGMSLDWNDLGLVEKVSLNDTVLVNYSYLADGTKVSALDGDGDGLLYLGSLIYRKTGDSIELESAGFAGGRFVARETSPGVSNLVPMIHVTDHLGSVRAVLDGVSGEVVETNDYYPFGSRWNTDTNLTDQTNRFRYNSKEEQFKFGTPYIDYGARQYDPVLGRWFAQDPLSEKYYSISPYAFCAGNPVKYLDPDGEIIGTAIDVISVGVGVYNLAKNIKAGNSKAAWGDVAGIGLDLASVFIPGVSTGAGLVRVGAKALNLADAGVDMLKLGSELNSFDKAADFGVDTYKNLRKQVTSELGKGSDLEVHHLIEKRFASKLGLKEDDIPSIVLTKDEHKKFTAAWREEIGYNRSGADITTDDATKEVILNAAKKIYKDYTEIFKTIESLLK